MKSIETVAEFSENGVVTIKLPESITFSRGIQKIILIMEDVEPEIESFWKEELDIRRERIEKHPHKGFSMEDVASELEEYLGKKIQVRT